VSSAVLFYSTYSTGYTSEFTATSRVTANQIAQIIADRGAPLETALLDRWAVPSSPVH